MRDVLGAAGRDVDRDVAEDADAALARVRAQRATTRARSEPGRRARPCPRTPPSRRSRTGAARRSPRRPPRSPARAARRAAPATRRTRTRRCTASRSLSGGPSGSTCHHDCPAAAQPVDEAVRLVAEAAARQRRRMQQHSTGAFESHQLRKSRARWPRAAQSTSAAESRFTNVEPQVNCGRFSIKRVVGEDVVVHATIFRDGPRRAPRRRPLPRPGRAALARRRRSSRSATTSGAARSPSTSRAAGRTASRAWVDRIASWQDEVTRKVEGGQTELDGELVGGRARCSAPTCRSRRRLPRRATTGTTRSRSTPGSASTSTRRSARFGAWYELFPRSLGGFAGVEKVLPQLAELGFDVVYLPPIHPIGRTNRKGRNNARHGEARATSAARGRSAPRRAVTTRSIPTSARRRTSSGSSRGARSSGSRSRSTSRSSARPTTRG